MLKTALLCFLYFTSPIVFSKVTFENGIPILDLGSQRINLKRTKVSPKEAKRFFSKEIIKEVSTLLSSLPILSHKLGNLTARNQGQRESCNVFPAVGLIEYFVGNKPDFSEQCLLYHSSDKDPGDGYERLVYVQKNGLYYEADCPYIQPEEYFGNWYEVDEKTKKDLAIKARNIIPDLSKSQKVYPKFQLISRDFDDYSASENIKYVRQNILANRPVNISVYIIIDNWIDGIIDKIPTEEEIKKSCITDKKIRSSITECGSHEILITGFDDEKAVFYFKNSWGERWGLNNNFLPEEKYIRRIGYGSMSYEHFAKFAFYKINTLE